MIASVQFRHFKALRAATLRLEAFNLLIGPTGSGKTSVVQALLRLRSLARQQAAAPPAAARSRRGPGPEIVFRFAPPFADLEAHLGCQSEAVCDLLVPRVPDTAEARRRWETLRTQLGGIRAYLFDHYAMAEPAPRAAGDELATNGHNLAAVLARLRAQHAGAFGRLEAEFCRILPEFRAVTTEPAGAEAVQLGLRLADGGDVVSGENLAQGALYLLAYLTLAFLPSPPPLICLEEADRGVHPRMLREVRDALYRLSHPESFGETRAAVQIVATTHSPFLLDLFRDHPEEIVIAQKRGTSATFERLGDRPDVKEILAEGSLGDIWFSGVLGGVPEE